MRRLGYALAALAGMTPTMLLVALWIDTERDTGFAAAFLTAALVALLASSVIGGLWLTIRSVEQVFGSGPRRSERMWL